MTVYKNGLRLGVMQAAGLSGEYCWAVEMLARDSVKIERAVAPASPSETELKTARAWAEDARIDDDIHTDTDTDMGGGGGGPPQMGLPPD